MWGLTPFPGTSVLFPCIPLGSYSDVIQPSRSLGRGDVTEDRPYGALAGRYAAMAMTADRQPDRTDRSRPDRDRTRTAGPDGPDVAGVDRVLSVSEAAARLGISSDAARKRLERGQLAGLKRAGRWWVLLPLTGATDADASPVADMDLTGLGPDPTGHGQRSDRPPPDPDRSDRTDSRPELDRALEEIRWLRERLEQAEEERAELRRLLLALGRPPAPVLVEHTPAPASPRPTVRLPWWRRFLQALAESL